MAVYARILRTPGLGILIAATLITRLPLAINGLAVVLYLRETTGSFAIAGLVAGAMAVGSAIGAPRRSTSRPASGAGALMPLAIVHAAAILAVWALAAAETPAAVTAGAALVAGAGFPPTGALLRSRLPRMLGDDDLVHSAYALDSVGIELSFVTGPLITAVLVALAGPQFALAVSATLMLLGTALFLAHFPDRDRGPRPAERHRGWLGPLADRGLRTLALSTVPVGFCLGAIEVAIPAFSSEQGAPAVAGVLLAVWSAASGVGGLLYGTRAPSDRVVDTFLALAVLFPLTCLPLALAWSPAAMAVLVVVAGLPIAPLIASRNRVIGELAPGGTGTESFTWLLTSLVAGLAAGNALGGILSQHEGWAAGILLGCAVAAVGGVLGFARRGDLEPRGGELLARSGA